MKVAAVVDLKRKSGVSKLVIDKLIARDVKVKLKSEKPTPK